MSSLQPPPLHCMQTPPDSTKDPRELALRKPQQHTPDSICSSSLPVMMVTELAPPASPGQDCRIKRSPRPHADLRCTSAGRVQRWASRQSRGFATCPPTQAPSSYRASCGLPRQPADASVSSSSARCRTPMLPNHGKAVICTVREQQESDACHAQLSTILNCEAFPACTDAKQKHASEHRKQLPRVSILLTSVASSTSASPATQNTPMSQVWPRSDVMPFSQKLRLLLCGITWG